MEAVTPEFISGWSNARNSKRWTEEGKSGSLGRSEKRSGSMDKLSNQSGLYISQLRSVTLFTCIVVYLTTLELQHNCLPPFTSLLSSAVSLQPSLWTSCSSQSIPSLNFFLSFAWRQNHPTSHGSFACDRFSSCRALFRSPRSKLT